MGTRRYLPPMRRKLQIKRKDGWMIRNVRIDDYIAIKNIMIRQKGIGRPWGKI
jgi:hypothetical protein